MKKYSKKPFNKKTESLNRDELLLLLFWLMLPLLLLLLLVLLLLQVLLLLLAILRNHQQKRAWNWKLWVRSLEFFFAKLFCQIFGIAAFQKNEKFRPKLDLEIKLGLKKNLIFATFSTQKNFMPCNWVSFYRRWLISCLLLKTKLISFQEPSKQVQTEALSQVSDIYFEHKLAQKNPNHWCHRLSIDASLQLAPSWIAVWKTVLRICANLLSVF